MWRYFCNVNSCVFPCFSAFQPTQQQTIGNAATAQSSSTSNVARSTTTTSTTRIRIRVDYQTSASSPSPVLATGLVTTTPRQLLRNAHGLQQLQHGCCGTTPATTTPNSLVSGSRTSAAESTSSMSTSTTTSIRCRAQSGVSFISTLYVKHSF